MVQNANFEHILVPQNFLTSDLVVKLPSAAQNDQDDLL